MRHVAWAALLAGLLALQCRRTAAQTSQWQMWPEVNAYVKVNSNTRVFLTANRSTDGLSFDSAQIGPSLDLTLKPLLPQIRNNDDPNQYIRFRFGYRYITSASGPSEDRFLLEGTGRYPMPLKILMSDRNRGDLRFISGDFSWRYRNRLLLERSFKVGHTWITPFARGELFFDSRYGKWNQNAYAFGFVIPFGTIADLETSYEHRNNSRGSPQHINAISTSLSFYMKARAQAALP